MKGDLVNLIPGHIPEDYHCQGLGCPYCAKPIGELRPADGSYYKRTERSSYYTPIERGGEAHVAKTPLHIARWAIQKYSKEGDWVLDPTIGAGTTAVEALTQNRNVAGMELQFGEILRDNIKRNLQPGVQAEVAQGDARNIGAFLDELQVKFDLIVNNPPYFGDQHMSTLAKDKGSHQSGTFTYDKTLPNIAFLKEGQEYWDTMRMIYEASTNHLKSGGHIVIGVKDQMRKKQPDMLHKKLAEVLDGLGLEFVGTAFLKHHPTTLFLNTYFKMYGVHPPYYQSVTVHRKK